jgi:hypothetical protein
VLYQNGCSNSNLVGLYGFVLNPMSVQTQTTSSTGTTGTTGTGSTTGTGTTGTGTTTTGTSTSTSSYQPTAIIGYLYFNGAGQIVSLSQFNGTSSTGSTTTGSTYSALQFTGTYTVNADCAGTMTISAANSSSTTGTTGTSTTGTTTTGTTSTTGTNETLNVNFVLTPATVNSPFAQTPGLALSFSTTDESGSGYAVAQ